jgi:hypothetical protein
MSMLMVKADWSCVNFSVIGACRRNTPPFVGAKVRYWQPVLMVETVKRSGQSGIIEYRPVVASLAGRSVNKNEWGGASSQGDTSSLQMNEAHVFGFPLSDAFSMAIEASCEGMPDLGAAVSYLSEQDHDEWRMACAEKHEGLCVNVTGRCCRVCVSAPGVHFIRAQVFRCTRVRSWRRLWPRSVRWILRPSSRRHSIGSFHRYCFGRVSGMTGCSLCRRWQAVVFLSGRTPGSGRMGNVPGMDGMYGFIGEKRNAVCSDLLWHGLMRLV